MIQLVFKKEHVISQDLGPICNNLSIISSHVFLHDSPMSASCGKDICSTSPTIGQPFTSNPTSFPLKHPWEKSASAFQCGANVLCFQHHFWPTSGCPISSTFIHVDQEARASFNFHSTFTAHADPPQLRSTTSTISGGFTRGGSTSFARKRHLRSIQSTNVVTHSHRRWRILSITLTEVDFQDIDQEQDDPMVITIELENFAVKKVIID